MDVSANITNRVNYAEDQQTEILPQLHAHPFYLVAGDTNNNNNNNSKSLDASGFMSMH